MANVRVNCLQDAHHFVMLECNCYTLGKEDTAFWAFETGIILCDEPIIRTLLGNMTFVSPFIYTMYVRLIMFVRGTEFLPACNQR